MLNHYWDICDCIRIKIYEAATQNYSLVRMEIRGHLANRNLLHSCGDVTTLMTRLLSKELLNICYQHGYWAFI